MIKKEQGIRKAGQIRNSTLILISYASAFFPRLFSSFGAPSVINFAHFAIVPIASLIAILTTKTTNQKGIRIAWSLLAGILFFSLLYACKCIVE